MIFMNEIYISNSVLDFEASWRFSGNVGGMAHMWNIYRETTHIHPEGEICLDKWAVQCILAEQSRVLLQTWVLEWDRSLTVLEESFNSALSITAIISLSNLNNKELFSLFRFHFLKPSESQGKPSANCALKILHSVYIFCTHTHTWRIALRKEQTLKLTATKQFLNYCNIAKLFKLGAVVWFWQVTGCLVFDTPTYKMTSQFAPCG